MRGFIEVFPLAGKCGDTPGFCGKVPGFPGHFSRGAHEHNFLGLCSICNPLFWDIKEEKGASRRKEL